MAIDTVIHTNEHSIDRVLAAGLPVVLVFWKKGVQLNEQLDPILEQLASRYAGKALIAKVDADDQRKLVQRYEVKQAPTLTFVKDGRVVGRAVGLIPEHSLDAWLRYLVEGGSLPSTPSGPSVPLQGRPEQIFANEARSTASGRPANGRPSSYRPQGHQSPGRNEGAKPVTLTDANFREIVSGEQPVLVDFWAPWCGPCRMIAPAIEQLAQEFQGKAVIGKLNVDENPMTAQQFRVMSIPMIMIFKDGQPVEQMVGVQPVQVLRQRLLKHLS
jgi:thioredoxin 1